MIWIGALTSAYMDLLDKQDVVAMAVFAHFCVYSILLEELWWVDDLGAATIRNILEAVGVGSWSVVGGANQPKMARGLSSESIMSGVEQDEIEKEGVDAEEGREDLVGLFEWPMRILELYESRKGSMS